MKAGIITHYDVHNHGAHMQLFALTEVLESLGYEAKALRYQKNYDFYDPGAGSKYNISLKSIPTYTKYLFKNGISRTLYNYNKRKTLNNFRKEQSLVGDYYSHATDLDVVIIGSDEIFSIEAGLNPCFWGMGIPCEKIVTYAASFGPTDIQFIKEHKAEAFIKAGIQNIDSIAVRDRNSMEIIHHYSGMTVPIVCDPVLLYDFSQQIDSASIANFREFQKEKYCIFYSYDYNMNDSATVQSIKTYAAKRNLKIYSVGYYHQWCDKNINLSPLDVLKWFACSEMVFTDTFHGSVFSLVLNVQFIAQIRQNGNKLRFLLEQYGVPERRVKNFSEIGEMADKPIDYDSVNKTIEKIRNDSMQYLMSVLNQPIKELIGNKCIPN